MVDLEFHVEHVALAGVCAAVLVQRDESVLCDRELTFSHQAMRKLNSVTVPKIVSVPKTDEEDAKRGNQ